MAIVKIDAKHKNAKRNTIDYQARNQLIKMFEDAGCTVQVMNNKNHHLKVTGNARVVEFYPTTGTINANRTCDSKPYTARGMSLARAVNRVVGLATHGY